MQKNKCSVYFFANTKMLELMQYVNPVATPNTTSIKSPTDLGYSFSIEVEMLSDNDLVKIINLCGDYLNIISPKDLAKRDGISSVSANKETNHRKIIKLFNTKFISEKY